MTLCVRLLSRGSLACAIGVVLLAAMGRPVAASPVVPSYIYGIDDSNNIWQINPIPGQQSAEVTFNTGISGTSNAVAFDRGRDQLFFLSGSNDLYMWNKPLGGSPSAFSQITTSGSLGISSTAVYNAAYYDDSFWFFKEQTNQLVKASLSYSGTAAGTVPTFSSTTTYTVAGAPNDSTNGFGDIAINVNTNTLYAATSSGLFYSVNLLDPDNGFTSIKGGGNPSLQLSFNEDYSVLYGHNYTSAEWFTVDVATGNTTALGFFTPSNGVSGPGFRDLGGASAIDVTPSVPEIDPRSFGSVIALLLGAIGLFERRLRALVVA